MYYFAWFTGDFCMSTFTQSQYQHPPKLRVPVLSHFKLSQCHNVAGLHQWARAISHHECWLDQGLFLLVLSLQVASFSTTAMLLALIMLCRLLATTWMVRCFTGRDMYMYLFSLSMLTTTKFWCIWWWAQLVGAHFSDSGIIVLLLWQRTVP